MKRAAGQIRKARRNKGDKDAGSFDGANDQHHDRVLQQPVRRKPTAEEAALTAKNYRLAKELVSIMSIVAVLSLVEAQTCVNLTFTVPSLCSVERLESSTPRGKQDGVKAYHGKCESAIS
jgi:hypothetical protein